MGGFLSQGAEESLLPKDWKRSERRSVGPAEDSVDCPTCQGTGRIPRGQEDKLVAVIPCTDQRLKPRRTKLYVCVSVGLCLLLSGLVVFFLFPRSVALSELAVESAYVVVTPSAINITVHNSLNISNENFAMVDASDLQVHVFYWETVVGSASTASVTTVSPRSAKQFPFKVPISLADEGLYKYCTSPTSKIHILFLKVQVSMTVYYLAHYEQLSLDTFQYLDCGANTTTPHVFHRNQ